MSLTNPTFYHYIMTPTVFNAFLYIHLCLSDIILIILISSIFNVYIITIQILSTAYPCNILPLAFFSSKTFFFTPRINLFAVLWKIISCLRPPFAEDFLLLVHYRDFPLPSWTSLPCYLSSFSIKSYHTTKSLTWVCKGLFCLSDC